MLSQSLQKSHVYNIYTNLCFSPLPCHTPPNANKKENTKHQSGKADPSSDKTLQKNHPMKIQKLFFLPLLIVILYTHTQYDFRQRRLESSPSSSSTTVAISFCGLL